MARGDLTEKQRKYVEAYAGNGVAAAIAAGYSPRSADKISRDLLRIPTIAAAIRDRERENIRPLIASRVERQEFWSNTMRDANEDARNRLKASELLGKSEGDFLDRIEHSGSIDLTAAITAGRERVRVEMGWQHKGDES